MLLENMINIHSLVAHIEGGYVSSRVHPQDEQLRVLSYTRRVMVEGRWNGVTKAARGLIVRTPNPDFKGAVVVERPFSKFYTLSQMVGPDGAPGWAFGDEENMESAASALELLDFDAPAEVTDKMDGSMLVLYRHPDGAPAVSSKGSFSSDTANDFTHLLRSDSRMLADAEALLDRHPDLTFVFEGTGPGAHQIVLPYSKDGISMIGVVEKATGSYLSVNDFRHVWTGDMTETMPARSLREALAMPARESREGVVVRIMPKQGGQMLVKIKQDDYLAAHRLVASTSVKRVFQAVSTGQLDEFMKDAGPLAMTKIAPHVERLQGLYDEQAAKVEALYEEVRSKGLTHRQAVDHLAGSDVKGMVLALMSGKDISKSIWRQVGRQI